MNSIHRDNLIHLNSFFDGDTAVCLSVCDGKWYRNLGCVIQRRYSLEELPNSRVSFVSILPTASSTAMSSGVLKERGPMGDTEVGNTTCQLGGEMCQARLEEYI